MHAVLDVEEFMVEPFTRCVFELVNAGDDEPFVSFEDIGRLGVAVADLRDPLRRMLEALDGIDDLREDLGEAARNGHLPGEPNFDRNGSRVLRPVDAYGDEIPWERVT